MKFSKHCILTFKTKLNLFCLVTLASVSENGQNLLLISMFACKPAFAKVKLLPWCLGAVQDEKGTGGASAASLCNTFDFYWRIVQIKLWAFAYQTLHLKIMYLYS